MIDFEGTTFTYDGEKTVLDGIDLHVAEGEFVCVLGGNGSGKSTLAKHVNALLIPDEGRVVVDGHDTSDGACTYLIRSTAGMVFQNPDDQLVASVIENDVAFGPENLGVPSEELRERVTKALAEVGLFGFERKETAALSGGQKQRVAIAGVLAMDPRILILDEASAMLDPRGRSGLLRVCRELHQSGMTILMITHFMEEAALADRVVVLENGRIRMEGTPEAVLTRADELEGLNLEAPFACELSSDLRKRGFTVPIEVDEARLALSIEALVDPNALVRQETPASDVVAAAEAVLRTADAQAVLAQDEGAGAQGRHAVDTAGNDVSRPVLIQLEDVSFAYASNAERKRAKRRRRAKASQEAAWGTSPDAEWALRNVSFTVREGDFFGIAGHTGSGKSTLIQLMNGLLHPTHGRVLASGADLADKKAASRVRGSIGLVFQYPEHQLFAATVYEDVAFGPRNLGLSAAEVDVRVRESLSQVGLDFESLRDKSPFALSGGQQRRVAFAGVLAMRPRTLILDEPIAGLDPAARAEFLDLIAGLHENGLTVVMVSHNMDDLARLCTRMLVLNEGERFALGAPSEVFMLGDALRQIGLGLPAPQRLAAALRAAGVPLRDDVLYDRATLTDAITALPRRLA